MLGIMSESKLAQISDCYAGNNVWVYKLAQIYDAMQGIMWQCLSLSYCSSSGLLHNIKGMHFTTNFTANQLPFDFFVCQSDYSVVSFQPIRILVDFFLFANQLSVCWSGSLGTFCFCLQSRQLHAGFSFYNVSYMEGSPSLTSVT